MLKNLFLWFFITFYIFLIIIYNFSSCVIVFIWFLVLRSILGVHWCILFSLWSRYFEVQGRYCVSVITEGGNDWWGDRVSRVCGVLKKVMDCWNASVAIMTWGKGEKTRKVGFRRKLGGNHGVSFCLDIRLHFKF